jgi:hypothetical protein
MDLNLYALTFAIFFLFYLVTTKEYETCEENEANENSTPKEKTAEIPKIETKPSVKHPSPPGKTKQKSITSFFTRK